MTFRDFMEEALYGPAEGFYVRRAPGEDFFTAPELHPAFAEALADDVRARLEAAAGGGLRAPLTLVEMGSGDGRLARQLLGALKARHPRWHALLRVVLVERVERLLLESLVSLPVEPGRAMGFTRLEDVPPFRGVLLSNELVDALPFHVLEKRDGKVWEVFVERRDGALRPVLGECSSPEVAREAAKSAHRLQEGEKDSLSLAARDWVRLAASKIEAGALITVDYGGKAGPTPPRCFYRHATGMDVLERPGRQDLTASVDFAALVAEGRLHGLHEASYQTLGRFLLDRGVLARLPEGQGAAAYAERNRIKTLLHPGGMGEAFKVLVQEKRP